MMPEETAVQIVVQHVQKEYPKYERIKFTGTAKRPEFTLTICPDDPEWTEKRRDAVFRELTKTKKMAEELL